MSKSRSRVHEPVSEGAFRRQVLEFDRPVFIDFWSPNCAPCKPMGVVFEQIAAQYREEAKFVKVNVQADRGLAQQFGIQSVPTLVALWKGEVVDVRVGFAPEKVIDRFVRRTLGRAEGRTFAKRIRSWLLRENKKD